MIIKKDSLLHTFVFEDENMRKRYKLGRATFMDGTRTTKGSSHLTNSHGLVVGFEETMSIELIKGVASLLEIKLITFDDIIPEFFKLCWQTIIPKWYNPDQAKKQERDRLLVDTGAGLSNIQTLEIMHTKKHSRTTNKFERENLNKGQGKKQEKSKI